MHRHATTANTQNAKTPKSWSCHFAHWTFPVEHSPDCLYICNNGAFIYIQTKTNSVALSPRTNYTDWATATCWRNLVPSFVDGGVSRGQRGRSPTVVNLSFPDRSRYFSFKQLLIYSHKGWADHVPELLLLRKSGSAGNRMRDLWVSSQELRPLDHRGGPFIYIEWWNYLWQILNEHQVTCDLWLDNILMVLDIYIYI
jgi:hypothetical protein